MPRPIIGIDASRAVSPVPTGTEEYSRRIIEHMVRLAPDVRFRLYTRTMPDLAASTWPPRQLGQDVEWKVIRFPRLWTHLRLSWEIVRHRPDALFVPAHVVPIVHPEASYATIHDLGYLHFPQAHTSFQRLYLDISTRWNAAVSRKVFAVSETTRNELVERYGVDESRIEVVHPGVDEKMRRVGKTERFSTLQKYGLEDGKYVLYLGTIQPRKNLERLIEAFSLLSDQGRLKLAIAGKMGWKTERILHAVEEFGARERVIFTGYVPEEEKSALLSGAVAFALVSLYEGFGFPVLEAQACGTPVLASNTSSLPEVAGNGALFVDPTSVESIADGLRRLTTDESLRKELTTRGYENLKRFSWDDSARRILGAILASIERPTTP